MAEATKESCAALISEARCAIRENKRRSSDLQNVHCMLQGKRDAAKRALEETVATHLKGVTEWKTAFSTLIDSEFMHKTGLLQNQQHLVKRTSAGLQAVLDKLDAVQESPDAAEALPRLAQQLSQYMAKGRQIQPHQLLDFTFQEVPLDRRARSRLALGYLRTGSVSPGDIALVLDQCDGMTVKLTVRTALAYDSTTVSQLSYNVRDPEGVEVQDVDWKDERDGKYTVAVCAHREGQHVISVYLYNVHVNGSPLTIDIPGQIPEQGLDASVQTVSTEVGLLGEDDEEYTSWLKEKLDREMSQPSPQTVAELAPGCASATPVRQYIGSGRLKIPPRTKTPLLDANENIIASLPPLPVDDWDSRRQDESTDRQDEPTNRGVVHVRFDAPKRVEELRRPTAERIRSALEDLKTSSSKAAPVTPATPKTMEREALSASPSSTSHSSTENSIVLRRPASLGGSPDNSLSTSLVPCKRRTDVELFSGTRSALPQSGQTAMRRSADMPGMEVITENEPDVLVESQIKDVEQGSTMTSGCGDGRQNTQTNRRKNKSSKSTEQTPRVAAIQGEGDAGRNTALKSRSMAVIQVDSKELGPKSIDFASVPLQANREAVIKPDPALSRPIGVAIDTKSGTIYVGDTSNDCVRSFSAEGEELDNSPVVQVHRPSAVCVLSGGRIAVRYDYGIKICSSRVGKTLHNVGTLVLRKPFGLAVTTKERLVTVDIAARRPTVYVFDACTPDVEPPLVHSVDITGVVQHPETAKLRFIAATEKRVAVVDLGNNVVYLLTWRGELVALVGRGAHLSDPAGVVLDARGALLVADSKNHRVMVFGADGAPQGALDISHKLSRPSGICVSGDQMVLLNYWEDTAHRYKLTPKKGQ